MYRGSAGRSSTLRCKTRQKLTTSGLQNSSRSRCHPPSGSRAVFEPWTRIFDRENVPLRHTCRCRVSRRVRQLAPEDFFHPTAPDYRFGTTGRRAASFMPAICREFLRSFRLRLFDSSEISAGGLSTTAEIRHYSSLRENFHVSGIPETCKCVPADLLGAHREGDFDKPGQCRKNAAHLIWVFQPIQITFAIGVIAHDLS